MVEVYTLAALINGIIRRTVLGFNAFSSLPTYCAVSLSRIGMNYVFVSIVPMKREERFNEGGILLFSGHFRSCFIKGSKWSGINLLCTREKGNFLVLRSCLCPPRASLGATNMNGVIDCSNYGNRLQSYTIIKLHVRLLLWSLYLTKYQWLY